VAEDATARPDAGRPLDAGPPDGDGDRLEDRLDPSPRRRNPVLFEDDFDAPSAVWLFSSVSMRIEPSRGLLVQRELRGFEREGWVGPRPTWSDYIVQARLRVTQTGRSTRPESGHVGLFVRAEQVTPGRYVSCGLDLRRDEAILAEHSGRRVDTLAVDAAPVDVGDWVVVTLAARGPRYACDVGGVELAGPSTTLIGGSVGFRSHDAAFEADWIRVFDD
jgi:hypothetical protein